MKINQPVTDHEVQLTDGEYIVSTTDLKGCITDVNHTFERISGYRREELIGRNHNIVRHPDVPPEVFADLWRRLQSGRPWVGVVKNRCKNGDFYWVKASVVPWFEEGRQVGYASVRTKPTREEIREAEAFYESVRSGRLSLQPTRRQRWGERLRAMGATPWLVAAALASAVPLGGVAWLAFQGTPPQWVAAVVALCTLVFTLAALGFRRYQARPLAAMGEVLDHVSRGDYFHWLDRGRADGLGHLQDQLQSAQTRFGYEMSRAQDRADELARVHEELDGTVRELETARNELAEELERACSQARELGRVQDALQTISACVMFTNPDNVVSCMNRSMHEMLSRYESQIQTRYPDFRADGLIGGTIDCFGRGWAIDADDPRPFEDEIALAGCEFRVIGTPLVDDEGRVSGTVVEWIDRTEEAAMEEEIQAIVHAASLGNLGQRVNTEDKAGFFAEIGTSINELIGVLERLFQDTSRVFDALARGDLTISIDTEYQGAFEQIRSDVNATVRNLTGVITRIRHNANALSHAAHQINEGNLSLARRVEQQAANLEETAASMEQITATVRQSADNSHRAQTLSNETLERARAGGEVVTRTIEAMDNITEASRRISDIISVIDDIAFQTNLLALNAAVEAARAGEQGRGFAVVATEVRNLAQRSAAAAKEIKDLIQDSVARVEEGARLVNQSGKTLEEIVSSVAQVNDCIAGIATAANEQYAGIDQVNNAVTKMDTDTQKNATLVDDVAKASELMDEQARELKEQVAYFRVQEDQKKGTWDGVERRSGNRPWSQPPKPAPAFDFSSARSKHRLWKARLRAFLDGEESMTEAEAVSHRDCDLGKWLYADGMKQYGHLPDMQRLEQIHAEMHGLIRDVIRKHHQGAEAEAEAVFSRVEHYSDRIVDLLDRLEQETTAAASKPAPARAAGGEEWAQF